MGRKLSFTACASCGRGRKPKDKGAFGYCGTCYNRWVRYGRPSGGPPPARSKAAQLEDLQWLLKAVPGISASQLAARLGVHSHTVYGYLKELRHVDSS